MPAMTDTRSFTTECQFILDGTGLILAANDACEQTFGENGKSLEFRKAIDFIAEGHRVIFQQYLELAAKGSEKYCFTVKMKNRAGAVFSALASCAAEKATAGDSARIHLSIADHSERACLCDEFDAWKGRLQLLEESSPIGMFQVTSDGDVEFVNQALAEMLGYSTIDSVRSMSGNEIYRAIHIGADELSSLEVNGRIAHVERKIRRQDGVVVWISIHLRRIAKNERAYIQGIVVDRTCLIEIEEMLRVQHGLAQVLSSSKDFKSALGKLLDVFLGIDGLDCGGIYTFDRTSRALILTEFRGGSDRLRTEFAEFSMAAPQMQLIFQRDIVYRNFHDIHLSTITEEGILSWAAIPVYFQDVMIGSIYLASKSEKEFPFFGRYIIDNVASHIRAIIGRLWMENALKESEENFRALAANANDGIMIGTGNFRYQYVNRRTSEITAYSHDELLHMDFRALVHPDQQEKISERFLARLGGEEVERHYEAVIVKKTGLHIPVEITAAKTSWQGEPAVIIVMRDISHRKRMEQALVRSEKRYRAIVEDQSELVGRIQPDGMVTFVNKAFCAYFKVEPNEIVGRNLFEWIGKRKNFIFTKKLKALTQEKPFLQITRRDMCDKRDARWQQWSVRAIFNEGDTCTEFQFVGRDISMLKKIQNELKQHKRQLEILVDKRTESLIQANVSLLNEIGQRKKIVEELRIKDNAINTSINGFVLTDLTGQITHANLTCLQMLQLEQDRELVGFPAQSFFFENSLDALATIKQSLQQLGKWMGELSLKRKDLSRLDVYLSANVVKDASGKTIAIMASFIDISELKFFKDQLIRSERLAATGQLAVSVAHEINSPLQAITILLSMLKKKYSADSELLESSIS